MELSSKMISAREKGNIQLTENKLKVIKDKYLRSDPSVEYWLDGVALNVALGDIIFMPDMLDKVMEGVDYKVVEKTTIGRKKTKMILLHGGKIRHRERRQKV